MKLYVFIALLSLTIILLNLPQSYAQVSSNSSNATDTMAQDFYKNGNSLYDQGNYQDAILSYEKALSINPTNTNALYNEALSYDKLGNLTEAISYYEKVLAIIPNDTDTLNNIGVALHHLGKEDEAISYYNKILAITPNDTYSLNNIGVALDSLGKHTEAISYYNKVLAISPNDTDALYNTGLAFERSGNHDRAVSYYVQVLAVDPKNVDALNKLNLTFNNLNKKEINGIQQLDQNLLITVGAVIAILGSIVVIGLVRRRAQDRSTSEVLQTDDQMKGGEKNKRTNMHDKNFESKKFKDDEWEGI